ncbi:MAG TPA: LytR C-terminal domain-containing protein [Gemmatimonadaceae bacterium]|nr:LytR C-terminal domain-containing protein [Gemmatimonadaceae bacterium]
MTTTRRFLVLLGIIVLLVVPVVVATIRRHGSSATSARGASAAARAPGGVRVRVQVLNGTKTHGLAQQATTYLRDLGYDVVETGTVVSSRDTTVVLDLSGHPDWASRIARALQPARVETRSDSSRYLDVAIVLGTAWRPPPESFDP